MIDLPFAHLNVKFNLNGRSYEVEQFHIGTSQPIDFRGTPQHELTGGKFSVTLDHIADDNLYQWAKTSTQLKNGSVLFQTDLGITVFRFEFENAYCINLLRDIDAMRGSRTTLTISAEILKFNGLEHCNFWPDKH